MTDSTAPLPPEATGSTGAILAASIGNLLEWYDFSVYALFAVYIGANFFPAGSSAAGLVKAFLIFGLGFVVRPLGSLVIGIYGDQAGRKAALTVTILAMGIGTLVIAVAPSYATLGLAAPLLLLLGRLLQGFSAGGEIGNAAAFLVEHAPREKKGLHSAWLQGSMGMSNILGAVVAFGVTRQLAADEVIRWGWRIPFLLGLCIVPFGLWLRGSLRETPAFESAQAASRSTAATPTLTRIFQQEWRSLLRGFGIAVLWAVAVYVLLIFMPVFVQKAFGFTAAQSFGASIIENLVFVSGCFLFGAVADRIGAERMLAIGAGVLLLGVPPLFLWLKSAPTAQVLVVVLAGFGLCVSSYTSVAPMVLSALFPTPVRATGVSITYNAAFTIFGGFAPAILTWFTATAAGTVFAPAWYLAAAALPALVAIAVPKRRA